MGSSGMFGGASAFNQDIGKWPIKLDCDTQEMFSGCLITEETFEGKLYGDKIAKYFSLEDGNQFMVWEPYTRWERRKYAVMFFSSVSRMNVEKVDDVLFIDSIKLLSQISGDVRKMVVTFI